MARFVFWRPDEDAPPLHRQIEEEYWQNQVAPVRAPMYQPLPYLPDTEDVPVGQLFPPSADEDYWLNWVIQPARPYQPFPYLPDADDLPAGSLRQPTIDEEYCYWVAPVQGTLYRPLPYLPDADDLPAGSLFQPVVDEDFWISGVAPVQAALYRDPVSRDAEDAPLLFGQYEEDYWLSPLPAQGAIFRQPFVEDDFVQQVPGQPEEDFDWGRLFGPPRPVPATVYQPFPYLPDVDTFQPPPVAPIVPIYFLRGLLDVYALRGQQDSYSLRGAPGNAMALSASLTIPLGDDAPILLTLLKLDGSAFDLTGATVLFSLKANPGDTAFVLQKSSATGGVVISNPATAGLATLTLNASDTAALQEATYQMDVQVTDSQLKKHTLIKGTVTFIQHPSR